MAAMALVALALGALALVAMALVTVVDILAALALAWAVKAVAHQEAV